MQRRLVLHSRDNAAHVADGGDSNARTAQLVRLISEKGPNISGIARDLGQSKESVRYRYKEKILGRNLAVRAAVNHEKLGLVRVLSLLTFSDEYRLVGPKILEALSESAYVVAYEKVMPTGAYLVHASVPEPFVEEFRDLMVELKRRGVLRSVECSRYAWFRNLPMMAEFYDFDEGRWDFDWRVETDDPKRASYLPSGPERFDKLDLMIIKELQIDGNKSLLEISEKLKINYKTLTWHYRNHVDARGLISGYTVNWLGSRYDRSSGKAAHRKHSYVYVAIRFFGVGGPELVAAAAAMSRLPFLWSETLGDEYEAEVGIPSEFSNEALEYVTEVAEKTGCNVRLFPVDQTKSLTFSLTPDLFDEAVGSWVFEKQRVERAIAPFIEKEMKGPARSNRLGPA